MTNEYWVNEVMNRADAPNELEDYLPIGTIKPVASSFYMIFDEKDKSGVFKLILISNNWLPAIAKAIASLDFSINSRLGRYESVSMPHILINGYKLKNAWINIIKEEEGQISYQTNLEWIPENLSKENTSATLSATTWYRWRD